MSATRTVTCPDISCGHCTRTIETELAELPGVISVNAESASRRVTVTWEPPADWPAVATLLAEIGFPPAEA